MISGKEMEKRFEFALEIGNVKSILCSVCLVILLADKTKYIKGKILKSCSIELSCVES